jgi:dienelactone hydrolase
MIVMIRSLGLALGVVALSSIGSFAQPASSLTLNDHTVGGPRSHKEGALWLPNGRAAPFAAVVVLSGCNGVKHTTRVWARRLASWGYAALIVDSFTPRGLKNVCHRGGELSGSERAKDAFAGAAYLRTRPDINPDHIAVLGYSHGGWTALEAATKSLVDQNGGRAFAAVVAYYPICLQEAPPLASDVQIFIGGADDWSSPKHCQAMAAGYADTSAHRPLLKIFAAATHSFDVKREDRVYLGHRLSYDAAAARASFAMARRFLDDHLRR